MGLQHPGNFHRGLPRRHGIEHAYRRCWQALAETIPGFQPLPDRQVLLVGAHGADEGARSVLDASDIGHVPTSRIKAPRADEALGLAFTFCISMSMCSIPTSLRPISLHRAIGLRQNSSQKLRAYHP